LDAAEKKYLDEINRKIDLIINHFNINNSVSDLTRKELGNLVDIKLLRLQNRKEKKKGVTSCEREKNQ